MKRRVHYLPMTLGSALPTMHGRALNLAFSGRKSFRMVRSAVVFALILFAWAPAPVWAAKYSFAVSTTNPTFPINGGEVQSTVVPPIVNKGCPVGRMLVTNDFVRPPQAGTITGHDLGAHPGPDFQSTFDSIPGDPSDYSFGTNDHDILVFSNGDIVLIMGVHIKTPLTPKPAWFDVTYHEPFGPGVRRGMAVWKSTDCGQSFHYISLIDPAKFGDGSCALPQGAPQTTPPGSPDKPVFSSGGVDGQLDTVVNDKIYIMFQCVGNQQDLSQTQYFSLSSSGVIKTFVLRSDDEGGTFNVVGVVPNRSWRPGIVPLDSSHLAFGYLDTLMWATQTGGSWSFSATANKPIDYTFGYDAVTFFKNPNYIALHGTPGVTQGIVQAFLWAMNIATRVPGTTNPLIAFPETILAAKGPGTHGFRMLFYNRATSSFAEGAPILPVTRTTDNVIFHLQAIDCGSGPILLYWTDINMAAKTATIRGRFILGEGHWTGDFPISVTPIPGPHPASSPRSFALDQGNGFYWYGDYQTGGAFERKEPGGKILWQYFPIWIEPDGKVHHSQITFQQLGTAPFNQFAKQQIAWKPANSLTAAEVLKDAAKRPIIEDGNLEH